VYCGCHELSSPEQGVRSEYKFYLGLSVEH
jgi:hypothetical protein